ncbi:MAG TPA: DUF1269 domain-containing protein [Terriglobia bacterium]|nr:DUF1269 domain-containing protein [Terriglobia bacterium]
MEKMLVVVFDDEKKAYEGSRALQQLDAEGSITIHAESVIQKNADGKISVKQTEGDFPIRTFGGTAIGSLIGLLGGPIGLGIGAAAGALAGMIADLDVAGVDADFLDDTSATLKPGKYAVVADVSEEWVTPVDTRMEGLGGVVLRAARRSVELDQRAREEAELRAEIEALKAEQAQARAERKAELQARIDRLNTKLQNNLEQAKRRSEEMRRETEAKVQALQQKAAKAQGDAKAALNTRATQIREEYERFEAKLRSAVAGELRKAADQVEKKAAV